MGTKPYEQQMSPHLSAAQELVFIDLRGGGQSTGDPSVLTFDQVADDLEAIRFHLGVDKVAILGHSIIGALAIEYGRRCPETVSHVIAVGTPPRGDMEWLLSESMKFFEQDASEERKGSWRDNMAKLPPGTPFEQSFPAQAPIRFFDFRTDMAPLYKDAVVRPELLSHLIGRLTNGWDVTVDSNSLRVPILLAHGRYDYTVPHTLWEDIVPLLSTATLHLFSQSGHQPFYEEPEEFATVVSDWMKKQDNASETAV
jgi:proline iminopeptidase